MSKKPVVVTGVVPDESQEPLANTVINTGEVATNEVAASPDESLRPSRRLLQPGEYWADWSPESIEELKEELLDIPPRQQTEEERALTFADRVGNVQVVRQSEASNYMKRMILNHELPKNDIRRMSNIKTKCIENHSNREVFLEPSGGGTGFNLGWLPPYSTTNSRGVDFVPAIPLDAYQENFISQEAVEAAGLQLVDFDPTNPSHTGNVGGQGGGFDISVNREKAFAEIDKTDGISPAEREHRDKMARIHAEQDDMYRDVLQSDPGALDS
jgi:hypothetical protein